MQLRYLPAPRVPDGLEGKLLSAIPVRSTQAARRRSSGWVCVLGAAAVVVLAVVFGRPTSRREAEREGNRVALVQSPAPHFDPFENHDSKETDPCNILPPLSDWQ